MTKLEQAARALLVHWDTPAWKYLKPTGDLMAALREALDHSGEANEMAAEQKTNQCGEVCERAKLCATFHRGLDHVCSWQQSTYDDAECNAWKTDCGEYFAITEGSPTENGMRFCHGCGHPIKLHPFVFLGEE